MLVQRRDEIRTEDSLWPMHSHPPAEFLMQNDYHYHVTDDDELTNYIPQDLVKSLESNSELNLDYKNKITIL